MPEREHVLRVAHGWVEKAENDLKNAANTAKMGEDCPTDTVCFHAEQCVEKYPKAFLASRGTDFPKTHDIEELVARMPRTIRASLSDEQQRRLTAYATTTRYPGDYEPIPIAEARASIALARRLRREVRKLLPTSVVRAERR